jgi:hypothetical protein
LQVSEPPDDTACASPCPDAQSGGAAAQPRSLRLPKAGARHGEAADRAHVETQHHKAPAGYELAADG